MVENGFGKENIASLEKKKGNMVIVPWVSCATCTFLSVKFFSSSGQALNR